MFFFLFLGADIHISSSQPSDSTQIAPNPSLAPTYSCNALNKKPPLPLSCDSLICTSATLTDPRPPPLASRPPSIFADYLVQYNQSPTSTSVWNARNCSLYANCPLPKLAFLGDLHGPSLPTTRTVQG